MDPWLFLVTLKTLNLRFSTQITLSTLHIIHIYILVIQQFSTYVISYRLFTFFTCLSSQKQSKVCNLCLIIVIYIYNQNNVGYKAFKITQLSKKSINIFYLPISFCLFSCCIINILLKVRQSRNNFFKPMFPPKNKQKNY